MNAAKRAQKLSFLLCFILIFALPVYSQSLTAADVQTVIAQAVSQAVSLNQKVTVAVTDKEGNLLGRF